MSEYNRQQRDALLLVRAHLTSLAPRRLRELRRSVEPYLAFRAETTRFQEEHLGRLCSRKCFSSGTSACCGREGIFTFFADVVINLLLSSSGETDSLLTVLSRDRGGLNCVYLGEEGCLWRLKPIVCEMFLCEGAKKELREGDGSLHLQWEALRRRELSFTRPTKPVLFDDLERYFINAGFDSPLMYFHHSPGLLRLKAKHGLDGTPPMTPAGE